MVSILILFIIFCELTTGSGIRAKARQKHTVQKYENSPADVPGVESEPQETPIGEMPEETPEPTEQPIIEPTQTARNSLIYFPGVPAFWTMA